jgi:ferredoxin
VENNEGLVMKVTIDSVACQGHGRCYEIAPDVFTDDDRGRGEVINADVPANLQDQVRRAVAACPEKAISFTE